MSSSTYGHVKEMNGSSNRVRLPVADRKVDSGGDLFVEHGLADDE